MSHESEEDDIETGGTTNEEAAEKEDPVGNGFTTMGMDGKGAGTERGDAEDDGEDDEQLLVGDRVAYTKSAEEDNFLFCLDLRSGIIWISVLLPFWLIADCLFFTPWDNRWWYWFIEYGWLIGSFLAAYHGFVGMAKFKMKNLTYLTLFLILMTFEGIYEFLIWMQFYNRADWFKYNPIFLLFFFAYLGYSTYICHLFASKVNAIRIQKRRPMYGVWKVTWPGAIPATKQQSLRMVSQFEAKMKEMSDRKVFYICRCGNPRMGFMILNGLLIAITVVFLVMSLMHNAAGSFVMGFSLLCLSFGFNGMRHYRLSHVAICWNAWILYLILLVDLIIRFFFYAVIGGHLGAFVVVVLVSIWFAFAVFLFLDAHQLMRMANRVHAKNGVELYSPFGQKVPLKFVR